MPTATAITIATIIIIIVYMLGLFILYFYRSPNGCIHHPDNIVLAPSYGTIMEIIHNTHTTPPNIHIATFLSPKDVHIKYFPINGTITNIIHDDTGQYDLAYKVNKSRHNEKVIHTIETPYGDFQVYQIAGFLVRRITYYKTPNTQVTSGEKLGIIHFGSRVDIIIPTIHNFQLNVKKAKN